jgi:hypothetical protein
MGVSRAEVAAQVMEHLCACPEHGYSQAARYGAEGFCGVDTDAGRVEVRKGDRDCSSAVCEAWELALAGTAWAGHISRYCWTGNMLATFVATGLFSWEAPGFAAARGDVYLDEDRHTAMCLGGGMLGEFSISETGGTAGAAGDQTGRESRVRAWYAGSWDGVLHYNGGADGGSGDVAGDGGSGGSSGGSSGPEGGVEELARRTIDGEFGDGEERKAALGDRYEEVQAAVNRLLLAAVADAAGGTDELARLAIAGEFGNGEERRAALGDRYEEVQARVNEILTQRTADSDVDELARRTIDGEFGNGEERRAALGDRYEEVQARVNEMLGR